MTHLRSILLIIITIFLEYFIYSFINVRCNLRIFKSKYPLKRFDHNQIYQLEDNCHYYVGDYS
jgi:hypothetical protein